MYKPTKIIHSLRSFSARVRDRLQIISIHKHTRARATLPVRTAARALYTHTKAQLAKAKRVPAERIHTKHTNAAGTNAGAVSAKLSAATKSSAPAKLSADTNVCAETNSNTQQISSATKGTSALDVTQGVIWKQLTILCLPVFLSSFFQQLQLLCNAWVVGRFAGKDAFAALQATASLCDVTISFAIGLGIGAGVIVSQYFGAKDYAKVSRGVHTAMGLSILFGIIFAVVGVILAPCLLHLMQTPEEIFDDSLAFIQLFMGSLVFSIVYNIGSALQRAVGDTKSPSIIVAATCVVNALLDIFFVAVCGLGTRGCGFATMLALLCGAIMTLYKLTHTTGCWKLTLSKISIHLPTAKKMLICGFPLAVQGSMFGLSNMIIQTSINSFGANAIAAWGLSCRMTCFVWMISEAIGSSVTTFSAQNFGARNIRRMKRGLYTAMGLGSLLIGTFCVLVMVFARPFAQVFVSDDTVIEIALTILIYNTPFSVFYTIMDVFSGTIRGSGESFGPMVITIMGTCVLRVVWVAVVLPLHTHLETILIGYPLSWFATALFFALYYYKGHWLEHGAQKLARTALS
jgi:hypothetical protein